MNAYLKFANLACEINCSYNLNRHEIYVLNKLAKAYFSGEPVFVKNLIRGSQATSVSTLHSAFKRLRDRGMLTIKYHAHDERLKEVLLTKAGLGYFRKLDKALLGAF